MKKTLGIALVLAVAGCGGGGAAATTATTPARAAAASTASATPWEVQGQWAEACSCDIPCPCLDSKQPTLGHCNEMMYFHVDKGHYGTVALDGLDVVVVGQSTHGKTFDQSIADKDLPLTNTYLPSAASDDVAAAAEAIFSRLSFAMPNSSKKHAVKRSGLTARWSPDEIEVEVPGVLKAHMKVMKDDAGKPKPLAADLTATSFLGKGMQGVSVGFDFHDDGVEWTVKDRHAAWAPFSYASDRGPLPWEPGFKPPAPAPAPAK